MKVHYQDQLIDLDLYQKEGVQELSLDGEAVFSAQVQSPMSGQYILHSDAKVSQLWVHQNKDHFQVYYQGEYYALKKAQKSASGDQGGPLSNKIQAPLTGKVFKVPVQEGQEIDTGETVVILESMKMETSLSAPFAAKVIKVYCQEGDPVSVEELLVELEPLDS